MTTKMRNFEAIKDRKQVKTEGFTVKSTMKNSVVSKHVGIDFLNVIVD